MWARSAHRIEDIAFAKQQNFCAIYVDGAHDAVGEGIEGADVVLSLHHAKCNVWFRLCVPGLSEYRTRESSCCIAHRLSLTLYTALLLRLEGNASQASSQPHDFG